MCGLVLHVHTCTHPPPHTHTGFFRGLRGRSANGRDHSTVTNKATICQEESKLPFNHG